MRSKTFCLVGCLLLSSSLCDCVSRGDTNVNTHGSEAGSTASSTAGKSGSAGKSGTGGSALNGDSGAESTLDGETPSSGGSPGSGGKPNNGGTLGNAGSPSNGGSSSAGTAPAGDGGETGSDPGLCEATLVPPSHIVSGTFHTCAIAGTGVKCWGDNTEGQLGVGDIDDHPLPVTVTGLGGKVIGLAASGYHSCALLEDGTAQCWGQNKHGELGTGDTVQSLEPLPVLGLTNAVALSAGYFHTCAVLADGSAKCWGINESGEIGKGDIGAANVLKPTAVSNLKGVIQIAAGASHSCAVLSDCSAKCWGNGGMGQIGNNGMSGAVIPTAVLDGTLGNRPLTGAVGVGTGENHTCAILKSGGGVKCWGENRYMQAGPSGQDTLRQLMATQVGGLSGITDIAAGTDYTCARRNNGTVRCWGSRAYGMLGDGVTDESVPVTTPVLVADLSTASEITVAPTWSKYAFSCALLADKTAVCWGHGEYNQQGSGTATAQLTPLPVQNFP